MARAPPFVLSTGYTGHMDSLICLSPTESLTLLAASSSMKAWRAQDNTGAMLSSLKTPESQLVYSGSTTLAGVRVVRQMLAAPYCLWTKLHAESITLTDWQPKHLVDGTLIFVTQ